MLLNPGDVLDDRYDILRAVGTGADDVAYLVHDRRLGRRVTLRLLDAEAARDPRARDRFRRDAAVMGALETPAVAAVHDAGELGDGTPFMVTEHVDGQEVGELAVRRAPLPAEEAVDLTLGVLDGLAAAAARTTPDPAAALAAATVTPDGRVVLGRLGSLAAAPAPGRVPAAEPAALLHRLLTGRAPAPGLDPRGLRPGLPSGLAAVLDDAAAGRIATADRLRAALVAWRRGAAPAPAGPRRRWWPVALAVAAVLVAAGVAIALVIARDDRVRVPEVTGQAAGVAVGRLREAGLRPRTQGVASDAFARGTVVRTRPAAGHEAATGAAVVVQVSRGPASVAVPDVTGLAAARAAGRLEALDLRSATTGAPSESAPRGTVISQDPAAGAGAAPGSVVELTVSTGPPPVGVPDVRNRTLQRAVAVLQGRGLELGDVSERPSTRAPGIVVDQDPAPTTNVARGTAVDVVVAVRASTAPPATTAPTP